MFNIRDFGAIPTSESSAFDNTAAIQAAINYAQATSKSKKIFVPTGEWLVLGTLTNYNNLIFEGESTTKHYWNGTGYGDVFADGASLLKGDYTNDLFDRPTQGYHATLKNLSFTGFSRLAESGDCRSFDIESCSFKNMIVLNAPSGSTEMCQNFHFRKCAFTIYNIPNEPTNRTPFQGRLVDCLWEDNIFVGNKAFDLVQARANRIINNRFEWIDRDAAITLYGCDNNKIKTNWFDRVAGVAIQLKQENKDIAINENVFCRCGGLFTSGGTKLNLGETSRGFFQIWGNQKGNLQIDNNQFIKGSISDGDGAPIAPKYVICLEPVGGVRKFSFKGNRYADGNGYEECLIYGGGVPWMSSVTSIETEGYFDHLSDDLVCLANFSSNRLTAHNNKNVSVREIPENLTVNNTFDASITLTEGVQTGVVFGGKVNGIRRFGKLEQLYENVGSAETVNGSAMGNKITYTIPISVALRGAPVYIAANYRTYNSPEGVVEVTDSTGAVIGKLTTLQISNPSGTQIMYATKFIVPEGYTQTNIKVNFYAAKNSVFASSDVIVIDAFCATYGDWITRGTIDVNNV